MRLPVYKATTATIACGVVLGVTTVTVAFVPPASTTTVSHRRNHPAAALSAASWKDLPPPELPPQVSTTSAADKVSFPSFSWELPHVDLPSPPTISIDEFLSALDRLASQATSTTTTTTPNPTTLMEGLPKEALSLDAVTNLLTALFATQWHISAITAFALGNILIQWVNSPVDFSKAPFEPGTDTYSPEKSDAFYKERPLMVLKRLIKLGTISGAFTTGLLFDWLVLGKLLKDDNYTALKRAEPRRAKEALRLCEQLGPTFIKLGQALSIRTDLVPEAYALELRALQDAVPPFSSELAQSILKKEFGVQDLSSIFSELTDRPVASASVGQVYRGILAADGITEVAVKVQRPGILAEIALDLYILRLLTPLQTRLQNFFNGVPTDQEDIAMAVALVDEWGRGFVAETDYRLEARNTMDFEAAMRKRNLDAVCAPTIVTELVRDKVLVTEWVQGTRLDLDVSPDVPRLCGVAINAYLTMLLDTGVLHCDPHKGNLLRTTDGRLCILDWGMTLEVPKDLQYSLLEFIAHINVEDYDAIPQDFINLGFSPSTVTAERLQSSGITEGLSFAFRQLAAGGGPKKIQERVKAEFLQRYGSDLTDEELRQAARADMMQRMEQQLASEGVDVKGVTNIMEEISRRNRELFSLPPYVLYLARAFSTLEGIGLSIDENYSIIQECYPYLASRLFTDRNPRAKKALKAMLGLSAEDDEIVIVENRGAPSQDSALALVRDAVASSNKHNKGLSPAKLLEMSEGFASYTAATANVDRDGKGQLKAATEFTRLFLDPKGSTLQDILVDETAKFGDAMTRATLRAALVDNPAAKAASTLLRGPKTVLEQNKQLQALVPTPIKSLLVDRPAQIPDVIQALVASTEEDEQIISTVQELGSVLGSRVGEAVNRPTTDPQPVSSNNNNNKVASTVSDLLSDEESRKALMDQLPGVTALGRRMGAGLLRRAAYRTGKTTVLPHEARKRIVDVNQALANAIEPRQANDGEQTNSS